MFRRIPICDVDIFFYKFNENKDNLVFRLREYRLIVGKARWTGSLGPARAALILDVFYYFVWDYLSMP